MTGRAPTVEDAPAIAALFSRLAEAGGAGWASADEVRSWLTQPGVDLEDFRVFERDGDLVAYADVYLTTGSDRAWFDLRVPPEPPLADEALAWAEGRARGHGRPVARIAVEAGSLLGEIVERRGYRPIRHSFRMRIDLDEPPPEPEWPDGIVVREAAPAEDRAVYEATTEAFLDHWEFTVEPFERWLHELSTRAGRTWFVAVAGDEIAGVCLCSENERDAGRRTGWVDELGVRPPWRRRGLGRALLLHAFHVFRARGLPAVGLGVDGESTTGAVRLYERAGMRVAGRRDTYERRLDSRRSIPNCRGGA